MVYNMCYLVHQQIKHDVDGKGRELLEELRKILRQKNYVP